MEMLVVTVQIDIITILAKWALFFFFFANTMNDGLISLPYLSVTLYN